MGGARRTYPPVVAERITKVSDISRLLWRALRLVWEASRREGVILGVMVLLQGVGIFTFLIQVSELLGGLVSADSGGDTKGLSANVLLVILANGLILIAGVVVDNRRLLLAGRIELHVGLQVLDVACRAEQDDFDDSGFHDRLARAAKSSLSRPMAMVESVLALLQSAITLIGVALALIMIQPWIGLLVALTVVPVWLGGTRSGHHDYEFVVETTQGDRLRDYLFELVTSRESAAEVRAYGLGGHLVERWRGLMVERLGLFAVTLRKRFRAALLAALGSNAIVAAVALVLIALNRSGAISLSDAATMAGALVLFSQNLSATVQSTNAFFESAALVRDLDEFLALKPLMVPPEPGQLAPEPFDEIVVDHVSFTYRRADRPAVDDVSLAIRSGEVVALVGENGSGKTTLTKLLAGLYPTDSGRILVDGTDLATLDLESWRARVAVLFQDYLQYALSVTDNIRFGAISQEAADQAVRDAARRAGADEFLSRLPDGYDTTLAPEFGLGQDVSLGQWQRIALARALFRPAPLVVLDEPTAALDARAERSLFDSVRELYRNRTVVLVSHRFSTVRTADRIVVLSEGRVVEEGTHDELMQADGLYAELFTMQASGYASAHGTADVTRDEPTAVG